MFSILYNILFGIYLTVIFPKLLYQNIIFRKYKGILFQKFLLFKVPTLKFSKKTKVWFHSVSLGEAKVGISFLKKIKEKLPDSCVIFSTMTKTGYDEIKESELVDFCFYLPFDFSWIMKRLVKKIKPDFVFLIETDFWFNFLKEASKSAKVFLINGKISKKSAHRLTYTKPFTKRLFQSLDYFCVQNEEYFNRFKQLGVNNITITGNVKLDFTIAAIKDFRKFRQKYNLLQNDKIITIASTHDPEERLLLQMIKPFLNKWKILIAPRHPDRFEVVQKLINHKNVILIKEMGVLPCCFSLSKLAIVGGSFTDKVGGHNILEPCLYNIPVLFGPHMFNQKDFVYLAMKYQLGYQIPISGIPKKILEIESNKFSKEEFKKRLDHFRLEIRSSSNKTMQTLWPIIEKNISTLSKNNISEF